MLPYCAGQHRKRKIHPSMAGRKIECASDAGRAILAAEKRHRSRRDCAAGQSAGPRPTPVARLERRGRSNREMQVQRQDRRTVADQDLRRQTIPIAHAVYRLNGEARQILGSRYILERPALGMRAAGQHNAQNQNTAPKHEPALTYPQCAAGPFRFRCRSTP